MLTDESLADFADRQMHQTSWIARVAAQWVRGLTPQVSVSRGEFTALLRRMWRLETVIPEVRLEEGFQVLDTERNQVSAKDFSSFRHQWEGHPPESAAARTERQLEKRLDHRHHAIDALVVALTNRSLYMSLARHYREEGERRARGESRRRDWSIPPAMQQLRNQALTMIRNCNLTHKPDRNPSGQLFDATAYGQPQADDQGTLRLTLHKTLLELADDKSEERTRKAIASIASEEVQELVLMAFEQRLRGGLGIKAALSEPVSYPRYGTRIWRVRCLSARKPENAQLILHRSRQGEHHKYMLHGGYACLELVPLPQDEVAKTKGRKSQQVFSPRLVTMQEAAHAAFRKPAPGVRRLFKGDMVRNPDDGRVYVVAYFKAEGNLSMVPACETRNFGQMEKDKDPNRKMLAFSKAGNLELLTDG